MLAKKLMFEVLESRMLLTTVDYVDVRIDIELQRNGDEFVVIARAIDENCGNVITDVATTYDLQLPEEPPVEEEPVVNLPTEIVVEAATTTVTVTSYVEPIDIGVLPDGTTDIVVGLTAIGNDEDMIDLINENNRLTEENQELLDQNDQLTVENETLFSQIVSLTTEVATLRQENESLSVRITDLETKIADAIDILQTQQQVPQQQQQVIMPLIANNAVNDVALEDLVNESDELVVSLRNTAQVFRRLL